MNKFKHLQIILDTELENKFNIVFFNKAHEYEISNSSFEYQKPCLIELLGFLYILGVKIKGNKGDFYQELFDEFNKTSNNLNKLSLEINVCLYIMEALFNFYKFNPVLKTTFSSIFYSIENSLNILIMSNRSILKNII
ncbi:hypothetical protein BN1013_02469 [Candidatus Rubidus massiliensis]|nr:hypothetical protein BN1013_02469 [Candidatus Rubidus massiliensis]